MDLVLLLNTDDCNRDAIKFRVEARATEEIAYEEKVMGKLTDD